MLGNPSSGCKSSTAYLPCQAQRWFKCPQRMRMKSHPNSFNKNPFPSRPFLRSGKQKVSTPTPTSVFATKPFATQGHLGHFVASRLVKRFQRLELLIVIKPFAKDLSAQRQQISPRADSTWVNRTVFVATGSIDQALQLSKGPTEIAQVTQQLL